jgi:branched-chain amino acid transport system ATP-binding protein
LPLLRADDISVRFGGVQANTDVTVTVEEGQIAGLIGPNGAGKTTLFNVLSGLNTPTSGRVWFSERDISDVPAFKRSRLGMARTFQRLEVFGSLSAFENVLVGAEISKRWRKDATDPATTAEEIVERVGLNDVRDVRVDALSTGHCRLVELGRALASHPKLILLDEPSSGLDESETGFFGDLLLEEAARGVGMLLVEHDVDLVMRVCANIHVLEFGRVIAVGSPKEIQADPRVRAAYLGEDDEEVA